MPTVKNFFDDIREAYLNDRAAKRFPDPILRVCFMDALRAMRGTHGVAFYSATAAGMPDALDALDEAAFVATDIRAIVSGAFQPALRDAVIVKANSSQQRGVVRGAPLVVAERERDTPS